MASLLDIVPLKENVIVYHGGDPVTLTCSGITAEHLAHLIMRFPALRGLMQGRDEQALMENLSAENLVAAVPDAISAILAAGTGHAGEPDHEEAAKHIGLEGQIELLTAIVKATLPQGVGPFVQKVYALLGTAEAPGRPVPSAISKPNGAAPSTLSQ
jgi:hypothetical protein